MEDIRNDEKILFATKLIARQRDTFEEIAELTGLSVEKVKEIAEKMETVPA